MSITSFIVNRVIGSQRICLRFQKNLHYNKSIERERCTISSRPPLNNRRRADRRREEIRIMSMTGAVPFWRSAGMTYITYSNLCASLVRGCLKEPLKSEAAAREKLHFSIAKWSEGKPASKPSKHLAICLSCFLLICLFFTVVIVVSRSGGFGDLSFDGDFYILKVNLDM